MSVRSIEPPKQPTPPDDAANEAYVIAIEVARGLRMYLSWPSAAHAGALWTADLTVARLFRTESQAQDELLKRGLLNGAKVPIILGIACVLR